jgi:hypothetical protein
MTATAPCSRCGTQNAVGARMCVGCQAPLEESAQAAAAPPLARRLRRGLGAAALATMISAVGAFAIYLVHQSMPAVPPGFERVARVPATLPPPGSGDEARLSHLRRPEPGATVVAPPETTPEPPRGPSPAPLRPAPEPAGTVAAPAPAEPARPQVVTSAEQSAPAPSAASAASTPTAPAPRAGDRLAAVQQAQCGSEALLARFVCNERVRLRFCRNRWNAHPDCEVGPAMNAAN